MNKKAQFGFAMALLFIIIYVYAWIFIFGPPLAQLGTQLAIDQNMTGLEGFIWRTLNIWAGLVPLVLYIIYVGIYGGGP